MSDDEDADELGTDGGMTSRVDIDERGFPLGSGSGGGPRVIATANPLQLKMEAIKREAEAAAKVAAKKAAMATRLAAFQGGKNTCDTPSSVGDQTPSVTNTPPLVVSPMESYGATHGRVVDKAVLDSRVVGMMKSESSKRY